MEYPTSGSAKRMVVWAVGALVLCAGLLAGGCEQPAPQQTVPYPISLLLPHKIVIHSFTKVKTFDSGVRGIEVYVEALDKYGDPTKAFGEFRFELWTYRPYSIDPKGKQIMRWTESVLDFPTNATHWDMSRTYMFRLESYEPLIPGQQYVLVAEFSSPYLPDQNAKRLEPAERIITVPK